MKKFFSFIAAALFAGSMMADVVTFTKDDFAGQGTANTGSEVTATKNGVTFTYSKGYCADESLRCYAHGALSITATSTIQKINFTTTGGKTGGLDAEVTVGATSYNVADLASQARFTEIAVTLGEGGGEGGEGGEGDEVKLDVAYFDAWYLPTYEAWEFNLYKDYNEETGEVTYPDVFIDVWAKSATGIAGEYTEDDIAWVGFAKAEGDTVEATSITKLEVVALEGGAYSLALAFVGDDGKSYVLNYSGDVYAANGETEEQIDLDEDGGDDPAEAITCAAVYDLSKGDAAALNDVVVTFANGKNVWVKDETASMLIYLTANTTWKAGDVLSGVAGTVDIYNGVTEVKPTADQVSAVTATAGEAPAPEALETVTTADVNKYIVLQSVEVEGSFEEGKQSNLTIAGVTVRNQFKNGFTFEAGKKYDVEGVVTIYQNNPQVYFITASESAGQGIEETLAEGKAVKVIREGNVRIMKGDKTFSVMGQIVK